MEPEFPIEFIVQGTPVSYQTKRREALEEWKTRVVNACRAGLAQEMPFLSSNRLSVTLFYFQEEPGGLDLDNMAKPILDAMTNVLYHDDEQVDRLTIQRFSLDSDMEHLQGNRLLQSVISGVKPVLYIRVTEDLKETFP